MRRSSTYPGPTCPRARSWRSCNPDIGCMSGPPPRQSGRGALRHRGVARSSRCRRPRAHLVLRPSGPVCRRLPPAVAGSRKTGHPPGTNSLEAIPSIRLTRGRASSRSAAGRMIFELRRQFTGQRGERREQPAELVSGLAHRGASWLRRASSTRRVGRRIGLEILAQSAEPVGIVAAGSQQDDRVEQALRRRGLRRTRLHPCRRRPPGRWPRTGPRPGSASRGIRPCRPRGSARGLPSASAPSRR